MDRMLIRLLQSQLEGEFTLILQAHERIRQRMTDSRIWTELHTLLNAAANSSKLLYGQGGSKTKEREPLRASIGIPDPSTLGPTSMRNHLEHIDERIECWWENDPLHQFIDHVIAPRDIWRELMGNPPVNLRLFRAWDPATGTVGFWGQQYEVWPIVAEVFGILPKLREEASKPHWED